MQLVVPSSQRTSKGSTQTDVNLSSLPPLAATFLSYQLRGSKIFGGVIMTTKTTAATGGGILKPSKYGGGGGGGVTQEAQSCPSEQPPQTPSTSTMSKVESLASFEAIFGTPRRSSTESPGVAGSLKDFALLSLSEDEQIRNRVEFLPTVKCKEILDKWSQSELGNLFYSEESMAEIQYQAYCEAIGVDPDEYYDQYCAEYEAQEQERMERLQREQAEAKLDQIDLIDDPESSASSQQEDEGK